MPNNDVRMFYFEKDIEKIQNKTNMYIHQYGPEGAFHLVREVIQNNIDECIDKNSPGKHIFISYDKEIDKITCDDDGRGFPETDYPLDIFCTTIQSGSKFFREQSGGTSGEFGLGLTAVNALSDELTISSYRDKENYRHTIKFENGVKVFDEKVPLEKGEKRHGTSISFRPSKRFLGPTTVIPIDDVISWLDKMRYLFPKNTKIKFDVEIYKGMKLKKVYQFEPKPFGELLEKVTDSKYSSKCEFSGDGSMEEQVKTQEISNGKVSTTEKKVKKDIHMDIALRYSPESITIFDSYCNYTNTTSGGIHNDALEQCFCRYMVSKVLNTMTDAQKEKMKIVWDDVKLGLCAVINLSTNAQVEFKGNAKEEITSQLLFPYLKDIINRGLDEFFSKNQSTLNEFIKIIKLNAKARIEMQKVKAATQKERMNSFKEHEMKNYIRCNNTGKKYKELFIVEGDSPSGAGRNGCDPDTQAFFMLRGVTANAFKASLSEIMENNEWHDLVTVLRCGIGKAFDINKLYFNRINILTDADVDGYGISSGILAFFYKYLRPLIEHGYVYKVFTPLYRLDSKENEFIGNKSEMIEIYHKKITKTYKIKMVGGDEYVSSAELRDFLMDTYDYRENLIRVSDNLGKVNKFLIEMIVAELVNSGKVRSGSDYDDIEKIFSDQKFITKFMSRIQSKYKEIRLTDDKIHGVIDGKLYSIRITPRFIKNMSDIIPIYRKYPYVFKVKEKNKESSSKMSIGEFLDECQKLMPKILIRYKGLTGPFKTTLIAGTSC